MSVLGRRATRPSRMRRPFLPKMSLSTAPMRTPPRSITFCVWLRTCERRATSFRRWRLNVRRSRNCWEGTKLGRPNPNWHTRASQRLSSTSVFLPRSCFTCCAWSNWALMPASVSACHGVCQ